MNGPLPWVWVVHDHRLLGTALHPSPFTVLGEKYARAVRHCALAQPVTFPTAAADEIDALLAQCDGVLLTGSPSNVHPSHFGQAVLRQELPLDTRRDDLTLPLVRHCVEAGVPLLGICRGFQEINVALGGSLHQQVHDVAGQMDHREPPDLSYDEQYAVRHPVHIVAGSALAGWAGGEQALVNSLHGQGIDRLADGLDVLARAPDGLVEAVRIRAARAFAYAVQWHPEWQCAEHPFYLNTFRAFGEACRARHAERLASAAAVPA